ncbi:MAG: anaerobic ribonucleoside-triphosphate reductase [Planctomycetota bacterium]|jgi:hypothetical protein|nr:anaerobic ribonucleoside-triphosphate reductase [Planctomycetota bacterium]
MRLTQFYDQVEAHGELEGMGFDECRGGRPGVVIRHVKTGLLTRIPTEAIEKTDWPTLEDVLIGKREPQVLQHMTRVVGYFSRVENWNKSKIGELKDRHKGNYSFAG